MDGNVTTAPLQPHALMKKDVSYYFDLIFNLSSEHDHQLRRFCSVRVCEQRQMFEHLQTCVMSLSVCVCRNMRGSEEKKQKREEKKAQEVSSAKVCFVL